MSIINIQNIKQIIQQKTYVKYEITILTDQLKYQKNPFKQKYKKILTSMSQAVQSETLLDNNQKNTLLETQAQDPQSEVREQSKQDHNEHQNYYQQQQGKHEKGKEAQDNLKGLAHKDGSEQTGRVIGRDGSLDNIGIQEYASTGTQNQNQSGNQSDRQVSHPPEKQAQAISQNQLPVKIDDPQESQSFAPQSFQTPIHSHQVPIPQSLSLPQTQNITCLPEIPPIPQPIQLPELNFKNVKSQHQLKSDFEQNQKILASLSFNIDDLFKKISSLTEQVQSQIIAKPIGSLKSLDKIQQKVEILESPRKKIEAPLPLSSFNNNLSPMVKFAQAQIEQKNEGKNFFAYPKIIPDVNIPTQQDKLKLQSQKSQTISMKMFQIGQSLGYGKFGEVLECRNKSTGALFALKKIFKSTIFQYNMSQQFLIELQACRRMNHPNIVKSYTAFTDDFHIFIINQYALGNQLLKKFNCSQQQASKIIYQVLNALKYMHSQGVVHRDLKPQNILIDSSGGIKICDFGWSSIIDNQEEKSKIMNILCGTLDYVSPEMANGQSYSKQVDLWSVGVLTYELIFGVAPFKSQGKTATFQKVKKLEYTLPGAIRFSKQCIDFIQKLLKPQSQRIRVQQCLSHPFITIYQQAKFNIQQFLRQEQKSEDILARQIQQILLYSPQSQNKKYQTQVEQLQNVCKISQKKQQEKNEKEQVKEIVE